ncbi:MAG: alpha-mannosidase [Armatimonadetes bacterium]|nr:alpha-mannosidase [Armatimonadota bacterium]
MPKPRVYFIGNTHIDHTWTWHWTEGYDEVHASYRAALDRMKEFPEFVLTCSSALHYRWVEENDPVMFAEIKQRVKEDRWQIVGGWVLQSDNNIPCGESFARQGLYGQHYFQSRFGRRATVGYCVDSFGHHAQLPQILRLQGLEGWLHFRPDGNELKLPPGPYRWRGIDGTEIASCRPPGWYCTPNEAFFETTANAAPHELSAYPEVLFFYGVGDHGGGPTIRDLRWMRKYREEHPELECVYGDLNEFYQRLEKNLGALPAVHGDLQYSFRGCYTTNGALKSLNRKSEGRLLMAEAMAALASMTQGAPYPKAEIDRAWDHLLTNHFHDVMCGTGTQDSMEEAIFRYGGVLETADRVRHTAAKKLTVVFDRRPPKPYPESLAVAVANSLSWDRTEPLEFHPIMPGREIPNPALIDGNGKPVDFQLVEATFGTPCPPNRFLFTANVPAGGAALYHVIQNSRPPQVESDLRATKTSLENRFWRVRLDEKTGAIRSLLDKKRGLELVKRGARANDLLVVRDLGDTWGTGRSRFGDVIGRFTATQVRLLESGPLRARLEVRSEYGRCTACLRMSLYRDSDFVDFVLEVMWNDKLKTVKIAFPLAVEQGRSFYEIPYGTLERPTNGEEQPVQKWLRARGQATQSKGRPMPYSVGIAADSLGGADVLCEPKKGTEIRLTLLRSPYHGYLTYDDSIPDAERTVSDQGLRRVHYRLVAGGGRTDLGLPELAAALSQPLQIAFEGSQPGKTTEPFSLFRCEPVAVHLTALKQAEDGKGFIARLVETRGKAATATVTGPRGYRTIQATLRPFEIQSWRWEKAKRPVMCDLLEEKKKPV